MMPPIFKFFHSFYRFPYSETNYIVKTFSFDSYRGDEMVTDNEIALRVAQRDERAFGLLVERYGGLIKSIITCHLKNTMYTEECVNDVLMALWQNMDRYDSEKNSMKNWIGAVCKYKCADYLRRHYRESCLCQLTDDIPAEEPEDLRELVDELLENLSPDDRELFRSHYLEGQSVVEIAHKKGDDPNRLYNRLSLGRRKLRKLKERES